MNKTIYSNSRKMKKTILNRQNWEFITYTGDNKIYRHKRRRQVTLIYNMRTKQGIFKDTKQNKLISAYKQIEWKGGE